MAAMRRREIERVACTIDVAHTDDFHTFLVAWEWHNARNTKDRIGALMMAATRMGGKITEREAVQIIQEAATTRQRRKADPLAQYLRLTDKMRSAMGIKTIGSIDVSSQQRARRRKEQDRRNKQNKRKARGAKSRAEYEAHSLTHTKPWEKESISRRTWFRRRKAAARLGTSPRNITPPRIHGQKSARPPRRHRRQPEWHKCVYNLLSQDCRRTCAKRREKRKRLSELVPVPLARLEPHQRCLSRE
jgi:hypothetical protein